ncbi:MAG: ABC transporter ATP-binding protein [Prolixibacteraceae bacterium]
MILIDQISFHYQKQGYFFDNLSFNQEFGSIVGLLGKNGAGKSTLLKLMAGLLNPHSGSLKICEFTPFDRQPDFLGDLFMVPEEFIFPQVTIDLYLKATSPLYPNFDDDKLDGILRDFELNRKGKIHQLSQGQRKKFLIAFALATDCKLLILDEPTNGLDIPSKSLFRKVLVGSVTDEQLVIISTHQVKDIETILDKVVILDQGRIIFNESLVKIMQQWQFKHVASLAGIDEIIYSEKYPGGYKVVVPAIDDDESELDLELLFKAILSQKEQISVAHENK